MEPRDGVRVLLGEPPREDTGRGVRLKPGGVLPEPATLMPDLRLAPPEARDTSTHGIEPPSASCSQRSQHSRGRSLHRSCGEGDLLSRDSGPCAQRLPVASSSPGSASSSRCGQGSCTTHVLQHPRSSGEQPGRRSCRTLGDKSSASLAVVHARPSTSPQLNPRPSETVIMKPRRSCQDFQPPMQLQI